MYGRELFIRVGERQRGREERERERVNAHLVCMLLIDMYMLFASSFLERQVHEKKMRN